MTDIPNLDPRYRGTTTASGASTEISPPVSAISGPRPRRTHRSGEPTEDIRRLSAAEERDLHFNGYPRHGMRPLHELCPPGGCQYKTLAENFADLDRHIRQDREPGHDDPEAGL